MTFQVIPRERAFFDLLERSAEGVHAGAVELVALVDDFANSAAHGERIQQLEQAGDELTHRIMETLNTTFVTPFDRHDIHGLASSLDDILDHQEAVADLLGVYGITEPIPALRQQAEILVRTTAAVVKAVRDLRGISHVERDWVEIHRLEREGDRVYRRAVADLFSGDYKAIDVMKWKDVVDEMEAAVDTCQYIANIVEAIALKHA